MPHIAKWDEKLNYVRPIVSIDMRFLTEHAAELFVNCDNIDEVIEQIASEAWFCEHMTGYESDLFDLKEVPWET